MKPFERFTDSFGGFVHRAEAAVLMRSLRDAGHALNYLAFINT